MAVAFDTSQESVEAGRPAGSGAGVRGCEDRIPSAFIIRNGRRTEDKLLVNRRRDRIVGPIAFRGFKHHPTERDWRATIRQRTWFKSVALVAPGARVTVVVPASQRRWSHLAYRHSARRAYTATLQACRWSRSAEERRRECGSASARACRSGPTAFSGGWIIDFARAPREGRCAQIIVRAGARTYRQRLMRPAPRGCRSG
jgi:hypothetical protein